MSIRCISIFAIKTTSETVERKKAKQGKTIILLLEPWWRGARISIKCYALVQPIKNAFNENICKEWSKMRARWLNSMSTNACRTSFYWNFLRYWRFLILIQMTFRIVIVCYLHTVHVPFLFFCVPLPPFLHNFYYYFAAFQSQHVTFCVARLSIDFQCLLLLIFLFVFFLK